MNTEKSIVESLRYITTDDRDTYDLGSIKLSSGKVECCEVMRIVLSNNTMSLDVCLEVSEEIEDLGKVYNLKRWASVCGFPSNRHPHPERNHFGLVG